MLAKQRSLAGILIIASLCAVRAMAQDPTPRMAIIEDSPVLLMPGANLERQRDPSFGGVEISVSTDREHRVYRASYRGRTHTAYAALSGPAPRLAFDPVESRFRKVGSTVTVVLNDYADLNPLATERGAPWAKAYPDVGFALIRFGAESDPVEAAELLRLDPRVRSTSLHFEDRIRWPMVIPDVNRDAESPPAAAANAKDSLSSDLLIIPTLDAAESNFTVDLQIYNRGLKRSDDGTLQVRVFRAVSGEPAVGPNDWAFELIESESANVVLPGIDPKGAPTEFYFSLSNLDLPASGTYYVAFEALDTPLPDDDARVLDRGFTGFTLDAMNRIQHVCVESGNGSIPGAPDPLRPQQWHLSNTGQSTYAARGGLPGEDMGMDRTLRDGPTGDGIRVAVVDSGLEICHPDLRASIEEGASFNFNALPMQFAGSDDWTFSIESTDPFNFDATGDHGTSVAGLIAAAVDNGIGGRGVAPGVLLRGYNMLSAADQFSAFIDSLGASQFLPNSTDVDIFNLSFGGSGSRPRNPSALSEQIFSHGVRRLRSGLGAIYVKAAGNGFNSCRSLERDINAEIGCIASSGDDDANLPYVIAVGTYNADGRKSSYASSGANIWISSPGGEYGFDEPALPSADQMGWRRGLPVIPRLFGLMSPLDNAPGLNPDGDYTALMNGSSAAAPNVSGAIALLLEESPGLTWRDVKHILATSARRIDAYIEQVDAAFGQTTRTVRLPWTRNAAGYYFHDWYGFGALDVDAALALARAYTPDSRGTFRQSGWFEAVGPVPIPDEDAAGATHDVTVRGLSPDADIEAVALEVDIRHPFPNDLGIHLVSPGGTRSVLNQVFNETLAVRGMERLRWRLLSNAFYGENPNGNWRIEVFDAAADDTGHLDAWRLRFYYGSHP